ncbi:MAG TPA: hypothetical protein VG815_16850, partial [Chloroflexota bacterium]|nr:hypothetical protein [Chloroflexota bacterium]
MNSRSAICRLCAFAVLSAASFLSAMSPQVSARPAASQAQCGGWKVAPAANPASQNGALNAVTAISPGDAWAVGSNEFGSAAVEHWNGHGWTIVAAPSPPGSTLYSVSGVSRDNVWAVGETNEGGSKSWSLIEHWNGKVWRRVPSPALPNAQLNSVFARTPHDIWAVGEKWIVQQSNSRGLIEHWNGQKWSFVKSPQTDKLTARQLESVTAVSAHAPWAVGSDDFNNPVIEHWNGRRWSAVPAGYLPQQIELHAVAAKSPTNVWAVGQGGQYSRAVAEHWNGRLWSVHDTAFIHVGRTGYLSSELDSVTPGAGNQMWAVGSQTNEEGADQALVERWNGRRWRVVGGGMHPAAHGLYTDLYGVAASASRPSGIWAVGAVGEGPGGFPPGPGVVEQTLTSRWNGA